MSGPGVPLGPPAPEVLLAGRYRLERRLGGGGMGEVWCATDEVLHRRVAVKLMRPELVAEPGFAERFLAEARTMATIRHRGVVSVYDYHGDVAGAFLVMEYVEGEALSDRLYREGRLDPPTAMNLVAQAAEALQAAHDRQVVHRDIKPGNLLVGADGTLVLTDFGIARSAASTPVTATGAVLGTPAYLAPEQVLGKPATTNSDLYALGVVCYECLAGRRPFDGDNPFEIAMKRLNEPPPPLPASVPPAVVAAVERALAIDPGQRWQTAAEFATVARQAVVGPPAPPTRAVPEPPAPPTVAAPARGAPPVLPTRIEAPRPGAPQPAAHQPPGYAAGRATPVPQWPATAEPTPPPGGPVRAPGTASPPPPPWTPMPRPLNVMAASVVLCLVAASLIVYSVVTLAVLEEALTVMGEVYGPQFEDVRGAAAVSGLAACAGIGVLALLYLLLAAKVGAGRPGARGWAFTLGILTICCAGPCWSGANLDTLARNEDTALLARELAAALPTWYEPLTGLATAAVVAGVLAVMVLLLVPPAGRYFRRHKALTPYPPQYPYYGYPPR